MSLRPKGKSLSELSAMPHKSETWCLNDKKIAIFTTETAILRVMCEAKLDLPYVPVWPGQSRFKRLSRCPVPVSKISRNFTLTKFSKFCTKYINIA